MWDEGGRRRFLLARRTDYDVSKRLRLLSRVGFLMDGLLGEMCEGEDGWMRKRGMQATEIFADEKWENRIPDGLGHWFGFLGRV